MNALQVLRMNGAMEARDLARLVGLPVEAVYVELVAAESAGQAWIEIQRVPCAPWSIRRWVAL